MSSPSFCSGFLRVSHHDQNILPVAEMSTGEATIPNLDIKTGFGGVSSQTQKVRTVQAIFQIPADQRITFQEYLESNVKSVRIIHKTAGFQPLNLSI
jgi:hypothetical protein